MTIRQCFFCRGLLAVILSAFLAPCHAHSGKARFHAVVDTDGAADDLRTLCMLLGNREVGCSPSRLRKGRCFPTAPPYVCVRFSIPSTTKAFRSVRDVR